MKIIDVHSHIDYIAHNIQPDVVGTICCAVNESQWPILIDLANSDNKIYPCFGVHPWFVNGVANDFDVRLKDLLKTNWSYMIGEIGLDKFKADIDKQLEVFVKQLDVAVDLQRNIILHCVGAWDKVLQILKQYKKSRLPIIVIHGFNDSIQIMQKLIDSYNVVFSVGKNAVYGRNCRIEQIPLNKIVVETDGDKDVYLKDLVNKISEIKHEKDAAKIIYDNSLRILKNEQIA